MNGDNRRTGASIASNGASINGNGASNGASKSSSFAPSHSSRASPFPTAPGATNNAMANPNFNNQQAQPLRLPVKSQTSSFATSASSATVSAIIRRLPNDVTVKDLRAMLTFSEDLEDVQVQRPALPEDAGFVSAILTFSSLAGAQEVQNKLHGKLNLSRTAELIVELPANSPASSGRGFSNDMPASVAPPTSTSSTSSSTSSHRQAARYNGPSQPLEPLSMPMNGIAGMNGMNGMSGLNNGMNGMYGGDLSNAENSHYSQHMFSPQSPIGNHLRPGISGKALIKNDMADDDEATQLLSDLHPLRDSNSGAYAENGPASQPRRSTVAQIPINRLSLSTNMTGPGSMPTAYGQSGAATFSALARAQVADMSPIMMNGPGSAHNYNPHQRGGSSYPAVNPADQNPPCNTLYVGNLPADTSEEELKTLFSKQRGYKRLCFRTKGNGPMCFVEFEDVSFATKALNDLYGMPLHNSTKGGIRLSFSKNPLGVRSNQNPIQSGVGSVGGINGMVPGSANGFAAANGPPPGLRVPPGFRQAYPASTPNSTGPVPYGNGTFAGASNGVWNNGYNANVPNAGVHNATMHNGNGYNTNGFNANGFASNGYASNGHNPNGYIPNMYNVNGDDPNEDDLNEDDSNGYDQNGYHPNGIGGPPGFTSGYTPR